MLEEQLIALGQRIKAKRKECSLTQQQLAEQCHLSVKTVQDAEAGRKNISYETLCILKERLGMCANDMFPGGTPVDDSTLQHILGKLQSCTPEHQILLLRTLDFLVEQFHELDFKQK